MREIFVRVPHEPRCACSHCTEYPSHQSSFFKIGPSSKNFQAVTVQRVTPDTGYVEQVGVYNWPMLLKKLNYFRYSRTIKQELAEIWVVNIAQLQCNICNVFVVIAVTASKIQKFFTCLVQ